MNKDLFFQLLSEAKQNQSKRIVITTKIPAIKEYAHVRIYLRCVKGDWIVSNSEGVENILTYEEMLDYIYDFPEGVLRDCLIK